MRLQRRTSHTIRELNLVPLIDVLLVVLFFYMIISPMMSRGLDVNLPKSESNTVKQEDRIVLTVTRGQEVFVEKERVDISRLRGVLDSIRKSKPQVNVYLRADRDAPYGAVVQVMDVVKKAGIDRLGMVTEAAGRRERPMKFSSGKRIGQSGQQLTTAVLFSFFLHAILFVSILFLHFAVWPRIYIPPFYAVKLVDLPADTSVPVQAPRVRRPGRARETRGEAGAAKAQGPKKAGAGREDRTERAACPT